MEEEFEIDGKKYVLDKVGEDETGVARPITDDEEDEIDLEKTHQIDIVYDPAVLEDTLTDIFGDGRNE